MDLSKFERTVEKGFEAASEKIAGLEADRDRLREEIDQLHDSLRRYSKAVMTGLVPGTDRQYSKFWPTEEAAYEFGSLILKALKRKSLGESTETAGGVLVPDDLRARLIDKIAQYGVFRRNTTVVTMGSGSEWFPKIETDLTIYCPGEGAAATASDMSFSQVRLTPKTFIALAAVSNELSEDSIIGVGEILGISITRSMAKKEDEIGFVGDGTSTYFGMRGVVGWLRAVDDTIGNIEGLVVGTGNAYSELTLADHRNVVAKLPPELDSTAKWYCSKKYFYDVMWALAQAAGVADLLSILSDRKDRYFMGYPVEFVHAMPKTEGNSQICCLLGDLSVGSYLGERKYITIEQSRDVYFANNQLGVRGVERIDINVFNVGDTSEPGAIVGLITAAS